LPRTLRSSAQAGTLLPAGDAALSTFPPNLYVGTSGWAYTSWKPGFYPQNVPSRAFLAYYSAQLSSVEVNYTFRTLPSREQLQGWLDATPAGFRFSFKAPQRITHFQRLCESEAAVKEFIAAIAPVRKAGKLGVLLFQLPPNFKADLERLRAFLSMRCLRGSTAPRIAFEFRHESWFTPETYALLHAHNAALCVAESESIITPDIQTATHRCYRLRHPGGYTSRQIGALAQRFTALAQQGETYIYFKHEEEPTGALNATALLKQSSKQAAQTQAEPHA
jgi:uncharacterized protein YecE (DUF72 family)